MKQLFELYRVGGCIRDKYLGVPCKDIDYTVVYTGPEKLIDANEIFTKLVKHLEDSGYQTFLITPDCFTVRAKIPKTSPVDPGMVVDFVLARKELGYKPGTRTPISIPGTLLDDLTRRDFTCNAMAESQTGELHDPFDGMLSIQTKTLYTPISTATSFDDDPLRILRAIRFNITKDFWFTQDIFKAINEFDYDTKMKVVSGDRIRDELHKCFKHDTLMTLESLYTFPKLRDYIFTNVYCDKNKLWLKPTNEL